MHVKSATPEAGARFIEKDRVYVIMTYEKPSLFGELRISSVLCTVLRRFAMEDLLQYRPRAASRIPTDASCRNLAIAVVLWDESARKMASAIPEDPAMCAPEVYFALNVEFRATVQSSFPERNSEFKLVVSSAKADQIN